MLKTVLLLCLVTLAQAAIDNQFCSDNLGTPATNTGFKEYPDLPKDFSMFLEITDLKRKIVSSVETQYSERQGQLHMLTKAAYNVSDVWVDVPRDLNKVHFALGKYGDDGECNYESKDVSQTNKFFHVYQDSVEGERVIAPPEDIFHIEPSESLSYMGPNFTRAGIWSDVWQTCQYIDDTDSTAIVEFHFARENVSTPFIKQPLLQASVKAKSGSKSDITYSARYDYVNIQPLNRKTVNKLEVPPEQYCIDTPTKSPFGKRTLPDTFSFVSEVVDLGDPGLINPTPLLSTYRFQYSKQENVVVQEKLLNRGTDNYDDVKRILHDFTLETSYTLDLITGECSVAPMQDVGIDVIISNNKKRMKTPTELFAMDKHYQYVGELFHATRGIDCDVFVAFELDDQGRRTEFVLYIATSFFLVHIVGFPTDSPPLIPIALEIQSNAGPGPNKKIINFYEFSSETQNVRPDFSACFSAKDKKYLIISLTGGSYDSLYRYEEEAFTAAFIKTLKKIGQFKSSVRLVNIWVYPNRRNKWRGIEVSFTLLGKEMNMEEVKTNADYPSIDFIYGNLVKGIKDGSFKFQIKDDGGILGSLTAAAINERIRHKPYSPTKGRNQGNKTKSSGHSPGDMAGIGIGLLLLGLLVGFFAYFVYQKKFVSVASKSGFGMKTLDESQS